jgi:hypothetical protein
MAKSSPCPLMWFGNDLDTAELDRIGHQQAERGHEQRGNVGLADVGRRNVHSEAAGGQVTAVAEADDSVANGGAAVVTGAGSGLGRCIARALLAAGWKVAVAGRRGETLHETVAPTAWPAESALAVPTDVRSPESVAGLFEAVHRRCGRLDLLVSNAGVFGPAGAMDEISWADWRQVVDTSLSSASCAPSTPRR